MGALDKFKIENLKLKIFILHGWAYSKEKWNPFLRLLEMKGFNPYLLSIPGLTEKNTQVWDINDYTNWLYEILKKEKDKVILLGHSNGGRIALALALKYPEKLSRLILIDSAGIYHNNLSLKIKRAIFKTAAKTGKKILPLEKGGSLLYALTRESDYKNASPNMKKTMLNLINADRNLNTSKIKVPTIIIWGENDRTTPLSDGKLLNTKIVNSKLYIVNAAGHAPQFTNTKQVISIIARQFKNSAI